MRAMTAKLPQAQAEATSTNWSRITEFTAFSESAISTFTPKPTRQVNRPAVESLLLGIHLRGWVTDREKEFLDSLAPDSSLTFLIRGKEYLQPEGVELFPFELIETAIQKGGDAVFTHRYQRTSHDASYHYTIYTAVIEGSTPNRLVLGFFGPDDRLRLPDTENRFHKLVTLFREACRSHHRFAKKLLQGLESHTPTILVNRCSGRVVVLNEAAAKLLQQNLRSLVDLEFGEVKTQLLSILPGHRLTMTNINEDELYLTIISVTSAERPSGYSNPGATDKMLQEIHNKLSEMTLITKNLQSLCRRIKNDEAAALSQQLIEVIEELDLSRTKLSPLHTSTSARQFCGER
jgi:hypothetical protein